MLFLFYKKKSTYDNNIVERENYKNNEITIGCCEN